MDYYEIFDVIIVCLLLISHFAMNVLEKNSIRSYNLIVTFFNIALITFVILYWGLRPISVGTDTGNYYRQFQQSLEFYTFSEYHEATPGDLFFLFCLYFFAKYSNYHMFLLFISALISIPIFKACTLYCKGKYYRFSIFFLLFLFSLFSFTSIYSNIIRNGVAIAFSLPFLYYAMNKNIVKAVIWAAFAFSFHSSTLLPILSILIVLLIPLRVEWYVLAYFACAILSYSGLGLHNMPLLDNIPMEKLHSYRLGTLAYYKTGFRADFFAYNTFFFLLFLFILNRKNTFGVKLLKLYAVNSCCFFFAFHIPFSDRFGIYSWFLLPILIYYCCFQSNKRHVLQILSLTSILFFLANFLPFALR